MLLNISVYCVITQNNPLNKLQDITSENDRTEKFNFPFIHEYETSDGWLDLSNNGHVILPANVTTTIPKKELVLINRGNPADEGTLSEIVVRDTIAGTPEIIPKEKTFGLLHDSGNINVGGFLKGTSSLIQRGDKVELYCWYNNIEVKKLVFMGFITSVETNKPIRLEFEDTNYVLKQIRMEKRDYPNTATVESVIQYELDKPQNKQILRNYKCNIKLFTAGASTSFDYSDTNIGSDTFKTAGVSIAEFLGNIRYGYGLESYTYYDPNTGISHLMIGGLIYTKLQALYKQLGINNNVFISRNIHVKPEYFNLKFRKKGDQDLGLIMKVRYNEKIKNSKNAQSKEKTKRVQQEYYFVFRNNELQTWRKDPVSKQFPIEASGFVETKFLEGFHTEAQVRAVALTYFAKFNYDGLEGDFAMVAFPNVLPGFNATYEDKYTEGYNGAYKVRKVVRKLTLTNGSEQYVTLDIKL